MPYALLGYLDEKDPVAGERLDRQCAAVIDDAIEKLVNDGGCDAFLASIKEAKQFDVGVGDTATDEAIAEGIRYALEEKGVDANWGEVDEWISDLYCAFHWGSLGYELPENKVWVS